MLAKFDFFPFSDEKIIFSKAIGTEDASLFGAFSSAHKLCLKLSIKRTLGITYPLLRINKDGQSHEIISMTYNKTELGFDFFSTTLELKELCKGENSGLFYYDFIFFRGDHCLFSTTENNLDIKLQANEGTKFRLLVYKEDFETPEWFKGSTMYHIFVDRFFKGSFNAKCREDAEIDPDWDSGVPQYAEYPGAFVRNNVFFGGNLIGIKEKLPYLASLGINVIYLSPIFKAYSNHKYDTGDYMQVDEMFGGDEALNALISESKKYGIRIILDGVFNHTGDDSKYFNKYGKYDSLGAYQSSRSPYHKWYFFGKDKDDYLSWWGIPILPKLNLGNEDCRRYLAEGESSVIGKYVKMGIGGIRLDVADELCDSFLDTLRKTAKELSADEAVIIGEVWENAADKIAYGNRRRYLQGAQLDSVMNYPFRKAAIEYLLYGNSTLLSNTLTELYASYPKCVSDSLMNILGTHDTERILTVLGGENKYDLPNKELAGIKMSKEAREKAIKLLKLGSVLQYTVYGVPSVFYGDEAGLEGYRDPFCRMPFPWGSEELTLTDHYKKLGRIRRENAVLSTGTFRISKADGAYIQYERCLNKNKLTVAINASDSAVYPCLQGLDLLSEKIFSENEPLLPYSAIILKQEKENEKI